MHRTLWVRWCGPSAAAKRYPIIDKPGTDMQPKFAIFACQGRRSRQKLPVRPKPRLLTPGVS